MHLFCLNDCLPVVNHAQLIKGITLTLKEFKNLLDKNIGIENAIITDKLPSEIIYSSGNSLQHVIDDITDYDIKRVAHAVFNKYPLNIYYDDNDNELLENSYTISIDAVELDALNIAVISKNEGFLFTPYIHPEICKNPLNIHKVGHEEDVTVRNLFGQKENTIEIEDAIININNQKQGTLGKLKNAVGNCKFSSKFHKQFIQLRQNEQNSIIDYFLQAQKRELVTPFYPDTKIVKDVTPDKAKCSVYELRVYTPTAIRVYFNEGKDNVVLGSIGYKSSDNQDAEISQAYSTINKFLLTMK